MKPLYWYEMITSFGVVCNSHLSLNSRSFSRENKTHWGYPKMDYHPVQGGVEILLAASRYGSGSQWLSGSLQGFKRLLFFLEFDFFLLEGNIFERCLIFFMQFAVCLYRDLIEAGRDLGVRNAGRSVVDCLRIERVIPQMGRELSSFITPWEAGIMDRVQLNKV